MRGLNAYSSEENVYRISDQNLDLWRQTACNLGR